MKIQGSQGITSFDETPVGINPKNIYGTLQVKVQDIILNHEQIDPMHREFFNDIHKFESMFTIYLKLHTSQAHFKSKNIGKLISKNTYKKVLQEGQILIKKPQIGDKQITQKQKHYVSFRTKEVNVNKQIALAQSSSEPFDFDIKPNKGNYLNELIEIKVKIKSKENPQYLKMLG